MIYVFLTPSLFPPTNFCKICLNNRFGNGTASPINFLMLRRRCTKVLNRWSFRCNKKKRKRKKKLGEKREKNWEKEQQERILFFASRSNIFFLIFSQSTFNVRFVKAEIILTRDNLLESQTIQLKPSSTENRGSSVSDYYFRRIFIRDNCRARNKKKWNIQRSFLYV